MVGRRKGRGGRKGSEGRVGGRKGRGERVGRWVGRGRRGMVEGGYGVEEGGV